MISPTCVLCCPHPHPWQPKPQLPAVSQAGACGTEPRSERESGAERGVQRVALHRPPPQFPLPAPPLCRELGGVGVSASFSLPGSEFSERGMRASPGHISHPAELGSGGGGFGGGAALGTPGSGPAPTPESSGFSLASCPWWRGSLLLEPHPPRPSCSAYPGLYSHAVPGMEGGAWGFTARPAP